MSGVIVCVFLHRANAVNGTHWRYAFELPSGMTLEEAQYYHSRGLAIHGQRLKLERPTEVWTLGLDGADGEMIRMIDADWSWTARPEHILSIEPWTGARIGRWDDSAPIAPAPEPTTQLSGAEPPDPAEIERRQHLLSLSRTVPGGDLVVTPRPAWVRPDAPRGGPTGIIVWVQTYKTVVVDGAKDLPKGHERFVHFHYQVADPAIRHVQDLVALLDAGCTVRGWRVGACSDQLDYSMRAPDVVTCRREQDLVRDDVRMFRPVTYPITVDDLELETV